MGFTGRHCEENANECALHNPCMNGGRCIDEVNNYKCQCPDGYSGTLCQYSVRDCQNEPNGGTCIDTLHGFRCLCTPCFYGDSCSEIDSRCRSAQRYNRTGTFMVKAGNEHQNDFNARRLTKYSEQKPCLSACAGRNAEISYFECDRTIKTQTIPARKKLSLSPPCDDLSYSERYAVEPTAELRYAKRCDIARLPLPSLTSQDGDDYYEEIDDEQSAQEIAIQQTDHDLDSGTFSPRAIAGDSRRRRPLDSQQTTDIQTNL
ncbi:unnamed protein product [Gongylonema pulchrum]|uniref:EGF-like domain-containing protein n=1 Tax=Gongylonema pulchrum TaxID=637853 RepID=A0A3P7PGF0_9BILA|nr:unnamed protein product [Gongylonema pulchrum]